LKVDGKHGRDILLRTGGGGKREYLIMGGKRIVGASKTLEAIVKQNLAFRAKGDHFRGEEKCLGEGAAKKGS